MGTLYCALLSWVLVSLDVRSGSHSNHVRLYNRWEAQSTAGCFWASCFVYAAVKKMACLASLHVPESLLGQSALVRAPSSFWQLHSCFSAVCNSTSIAAFSSCKPVKALGTNGRGLHFELWMCPDSSIALCQQQMHEAKCYSDMLGKITASDLSHRCLFRVIRLRHTLQH